VRTNAVLPTDQIKFPGQFWDVQAGGAYLHQRDGGWSWGVTLNVGSASDHPFNSIHEATLSALAFVRKPSGERDAWLFFVVSTTNGQVGHNIPIPGVAYEYNSDRLHAVIGLPFLTVDYWATDVVQLELIYAAITDVLVRGSYHLTQHARVFVGYEWFNQAWLRADRQRSSDQTFLYEMRAEVGLGYKLAGRLDLRASAGYAFNRFFVENAGWNLADATAWIWHLVPTSLPNSSSSSKPRAGPACLLSTRPMNCKRDDATMTKATASHASERSRSPNVRHRREWCPQRPDQMA
jgi:hypothetical protein